MFCSCLAQIVSLNAPLLLCCCLRSWILTAACWGKEATATEKKTISASFKTFRQQNKTYVLLHRSLHRENQSFLLFCTGFPSASSDMHQQRGLQDNKEVTPMSTNHTGQSSSVALLVKVTLTASASSHVPMTKPSLHFLYLEI